MPRTNKNKKSNRRGAAAARTARAPGQPPAASTPPGLVPAKKVPPGPAQAKSVPPGPVPAKKVPPGPAQAKSVPPGPTQAKSVPPGLARATKVPPGPAPAKNSAPGLVLGTGEHAKPVPAVGVPAGPARPPDKAAGEAPAAAGPGTPHGTTSDGVPRWAAKAVEELLTVTYWLDPGDDGDPFSATIRFSGRRTEVTGKPQARDSFVQEETVEGIVPRSGPVAITAEIRGINPGQWAVTARSVARVGGRPYRSYPPPGEKPADGLRTPRPRRVTIPAAPAPAVHTATLLRSKVPGIIRFAYASLVCLGVLAGLGLESLLLSHGHYSLFRPMLFSVIAIVAGVISGKGWYVAVHRGRKFDGWCIQGFVAGAAVVVAAAAIAGPGIPAGAFLAAAAPALLIGMGIGRLGCFWAGCCTGRPTASRWGIWSSDRRLGCRRAPAQLLEALAALIIGVAVLAVVLVSGLPRSGPVAVVGLAAYTLCRQFILGLRAEPRQWRYGRRVTAAAAIIALIAGIALLARG
jgi:phosphatidylglycerol:prolipoprotein diacylglycerol transferase